MRGWLQYNSILTDRIYVFINIQASDNEAQPVVFGRVDFRDDVNEATIWLAICQNFHRCQLASEGLWLGAAIGTFQ